MTEQLRVPAGREGGGRFASAACPAVYALLDTLAPAEGRSTRIDVLAPRCPHGHFARWAAANCCGSNPVVVIGTDAAPCTGRTTTGDRCTRTTTRRDGHGRPACHSHGGRPAAATS